MAKTDANMQDSEERREQRKNSFVNRAARRRIAKKNGVFKAPRHIGWRRMGADKPAENVETIIKDKEQADGQK